MVRLKKGFKLSNPWATEVVKGNLNYLVRVYPTKNIGRVAVIATKTIDPIWLDKASEKEINKIIGNSGIIGSIEILECMEVNPNELRERLIDLAGKNYWEYYPKHMIPARWPYIYIWILDKPRKWKKSKKVETKGMTWVNIDILDE